MPTAATTSMAGLRAWAYFTIFICEGEQIAAAAGEAAGLALLEAEGADLAGGGEVLGKLAGDASRARVATARRA
jgi:hypothetical protein